jgi:large subunit ribosomal protein L24
MHNLNKTHIRQGDTVKVISGKDKGKIGEISKVLKQTGQVIIKELNIKKKHIKPKKEGDVGRISQFEAPIHSSNVMLYDRDNKLASRSGIKLDPAGKKVRVLKKLMK